MKLSQNTILKLASIVAVTAGMLTIKLVGSLVFKITTVVFKVG